MDSLHRHVDVSPQHVTSGMSWALAGKHSLLQHPDPYTLFVHQPRFLTPPARRASPQPGEQPKLFLISHGTAFVPGHFSSGRGRAQGLYPGLHRQNGYGNMSRGIQTRGPLRCVSQTPRVAPAAVPLSATVAILLLLPRSVQGHVSLPDMCVPV
jgi:hypothetical protein